MTRRRLALAGFLSLLGGGALAAQTAADAFVPLVAIADTTAQCAAMTAALDPDERGFQLRFGPIGSPSRVVAAVWDTSGHFRRYSDVRGDLRGPGTPPNERGPRTSIMIDARKGFALLVNETHGQSRGAAMALVSDALASERLGSPQKVLARLHTQCGAPPT